MIHLLLLIVTFVTLSEGAYPFTGPKYQAQTRQQKISAIWKSLTANKKSLDWYSSVAMAEMFLQSMNTSFDTTDDHFPNQYIIPVERKKLIHTIGVVAQAKFKITNTTTGYTGLFKSGCDSAILRLSLAKTPLKENTEGAFAPGIAIKFLRNGQPAGNIFAMYSLVGQDNFNFFDHDLTNHVPYPGSWMGTAERLLLNKFLTASTWPTLLGVSDMARFDQSGRAVSNPKFPYRLIYHPNKKYHNGFPRGYTGENFAVQLEKGLDIGHVYDVYVEDAPLDGRYFKIGEMELTTKATRSNFGDRHLFHQHTRFEDDLHYYPEWTSRTFRDIARQEAAPSPGYDYGDLPYF